MQQCSQGRNPFISVLRDLRKGREPEKVDVWQEQLEQYAISEGFFQEVVIEEDPEEPAEGARKRKRKKLKGRVREVRLAAKEHLLAFDQQLQQTCKVGFEDFRAINNATNEFGKRKLLVWFMDQGSSQFALIWWLGYKMGVRGVFVMDVYHREWNDCKLGLIRSNLWWVVSVTMLLYNLAYGPWEGCAFFRQLQDGISTAIECLQPSDPLFVALYPQIATDNGGVPIGTLNDRLKVLLDIQDLDCFGAKGPRAAKQEPQGI